MTKLLSATRREFPLRTLAVINAANSYRRGGQFVLFLKKTKAGELTVNWYALAPVNEQLHSDDDPWLGLGSGAHSFPTLNPSHHPKRLG